MTPNDKQAGDVKRYDLEDNHLGGESMAENDNGEFVRFSDIAHLLKPQEPVVRLNDKIFGRPEPITKDDHEFLNSVTGKPQETGESVHFSANRVGKTYALELEAKIEKLEAENRRLHELIVEANGFMMLQDPELESDYEDFKDRWREALNSGGVNG